MVEEVGPGVTALQARRPRGVRLHPVAAAAARAAPPATRTCATSVPPWATGRQITDGTARHHAQDQDLGLMCLLGTFAHHTVVNEASCIKIDDDVPLDRACLLGCGVVTGWGSAVYAAEVQPGDTVAVVGVGGIGANAIQGAKLAGAKRIIAIDPLENKRERAMDFGATHTAASLDEALPAHHRHHLGHDGQQGHHDHGRRRRRGAGRRRWPSPSKRGRVVITNVHPALEMQRQGEPVRPHADGEAGRRLAVRLGQPPLRHPEAARACGARASSTSTASSPRPTRSTASTRATRTCAPAEHPRRHGLRADAALSAPTRSARTIGARSHGRTAAPRRLCRRPADSLSCAPAITRGVHVKTRAAVLWGVGQDWKVEEIDLDPPKAGRGAGGDEGRRPLPLRRAPRHRRHGDGRGGPGRRRAARVLPDHRRPRGCRHREGGRPGRHHR